MDYLSGMIFNQTGWVISTAELATAGIAALVFLAFVVALVRSGRARRRAEAAATTRAAELQGHVSELLKTQSELSGRLQSMSEMFGTGQSHLNKTLSDRLDSLGHRLSQSVGEQTRTTGESLKQLYERLAILDVAQKNINDLAGQVTNLSNILDNKQTRGAFGQGRMEAIIADGLPKGAYGFQATLSNRNRPDCLVFMPNAAPPLVVDAKFPLEGYSALKEAASPEGLKSAQQHFRTDIIKHVKDIKDRYLIPGETQDTAFMFVPSESVFAEIHERFEDIVQRAYKARVVIVSPSLLMLSIQVIQAVLKDARLREQAHIIHDEVMKLMTDIGRLDDRVRKLAQHFGQAQVDIDQILTSSDKVTKRGRRIESLGFGDSKPDDLATDQAAERPRPRLAGNE